MWWKKVSSTLLVPAVIIGLSLCVSSVAFAGSIAVVNGGGQASIAKKKLKKILLGKQKKWDDGTVIVLVMLEGGDTHGEFVKKFAGKSAKQFTNYWRKMVFSGKGKMPRAFADEAALIAFVGETPGALGYATEGAALGGAKAAAID